MHDTKVLKYVHVHVNVHMDTSNGACNSVLYTVSDLAYEYNSPSHRTEDKQGTLTRTLVRC